LARRQKIARRLLRHGFQADVSKRELEHHAVVIRKTGPFTGTSQVVSLVRVPIDRQLPSEGCGTR
jgi:hypothetical protein